MAAPSLADVGADAEREIVFGTVTYRVVVFDLPGVAANARRLWGIGRGSPLRNGRPVAPANPTLASSNLADGTEGAQRTGGVHR